MKHHKPLHWPGDVKRSLKKQPSQFKHTWSQAFLELKEEVRLAGLKRPMLTSNVVTDAALNLQKVHNDDPGVTLIYTTPGGSRKVLLSDKYRKAADNLYAIALMIRYTRKTRRLKVLCRDVVTEPQHAPMELFNQ